MPSCVGATRVGLVECALFSRINACVPLSQRVLTAAQAKLEEVEAEGEEEETAGEGEEGGEGGEKAHKVRRKRAKTIIKALSEE